jgi:protocatechuate 3,4-dioxygenase beta subunit
MKLIRGLWLSAVTVSAMACAQAPPGAMGSIEGTVTDAVSGVPLPAITVTLVGPEILSPVKTDEQGHYVARGLGAGQYLVLGTNAPGYAAGSARVRLALAQELKGVDLKLDREAVITGRILDLDGKPVGGARVSVRGQGYREGRAVLTGSQSATANERGEFRLDGLSAGKYYFEADVKPLAVRKRQPGEPATEDKPPAIADVRTYYGNSPSLEGAVLLAVAAGQQLEGFNLTLLRERTMCIGSAVEDADAPNGRVGVIVSELMPMSQSRVAGDSVGSGEEFEICGLPAGSYRLWSFTTKARPRYAGQTFTLGSRPVKLPRLTVSGYVAVKGRVTVADANAEDPAPRVRVRLGLKDRAAIAGEELAAVFDSTGGFVIPGTLNDEYWLEVTGLPSGYYVRAATQNRREAWREAVRAGAGEVAIVLGSDGPALNGQVLGKDGRPVANATVILAAAPLAAAPGPGQIFTTVTDQNGQYALQNMAPGAYRAMVFGNVPVEEAGAPEFLRAHVPEGVAVTLGPRERKMQTLSVLDERP